MTTTPDPLSAGLMTMSVRLVRFSRNISILLNLIYFENLFRDIGFSSSYCFVPIKTTPTSLQIPNLVTTINSK